MKTDVQKKSSFFIRMFVILRKGGGDGEAVATEKYVDIMGHIVNGGGHPFSDRNG